MAKAAGAGILFQRTAQSIFLLITGQQYDSMKKRIMAKGFYALGFSKETFRKHVLQAMHGSYDGYIQCRYCNGYFGIGQFAVDHVVPLSRGGGVELSNLDYPCKQCNFRKGSLLPDEYLKLLEFLEQKIPMARVDILNRLEISVQLVTAERYRRKKSKAKQDQG